MCPYFALYDVVNQTSINADSSGPNTADTIVAITSATRDDWANVDNGRVEDGAVASCIMVGDCMSENLKVTDFDFVIPDSGTINGVVVEIKRRRTLALGGARDHALFLVKNGTAVGDTRATADTYPTTLEWKSYGGSSDLWGTT